MNIQWLLVGGPLDGKTVWVKRGGRVQVGGATYSGQNYPHDGRLYRVGFVDPNDLEPSRVIGLIRSTGVQHLTDS